MGKTLYKGSKVLTQEFCRKWVALLITVDKSFQLRRAKPVKTNCCCWGTARFSFNVITSFHYKMKCLVRTFSNIGRLKYSKVLQRIQL